MALGFSEMERVLMEQLRLYHHPVAITWLFSDEAVKEFKAAAPHIVPVKPLTFCQWELATRMQGRTVLGTRETLACSSARITFGWQEIDAKEISSHLKYCDDAEQAERFLRAKPRLPEGLKAVGVSPLGKAKMRPDVVHFYCDNIQSYHLSVDYMAATNTHPLRPMVCVSSAACGGAVFCWNEKTFNLCPACVGGYNSGKTERGEVNAFVPGEHIELVVNRLLERVKRSGGSGFSRAGDAFPGGDICKNCPLIIFKEGEAGDGVCSSCHAKNI